MNKKGLTLIALYWFMILVIVSGGIVLMTNAFYSAPYNVRDLEVGILNRQVSDCLYYAGKANPLLFDSSGGFLKKGDSESFLDCPLNFLDKDGSSLYYAKASFYPFDNENTKLFEISEGNKNWETDCDNPVKKKENLATCLEKEFFMKNDFGGIYLVKVLTIVGKVKENV